MASSGSPLPKACENCRIRKVRCNRLNPCSNCQTSNIPCRPASHPARRKPRTGNGRPSSTASSTSHTLPVDRSPELDHPRRGLTQALEHPLRGPIVSSPTDNLRVLAEAAEQSPSTNCAFEGSSSFTDQAMHASRMAGVDGANLSHQDSIMAAMESKDDDESQEYCFRGNPQRNRDMHLEMPPAGFVLDLLKELKKRPSKILLAYCMHLLVPNVEELCREAYFPIKPMSFGALATMYGMLYYLTQDLFIEPESDLAKKYDYQAYSELLERNFHFALENYSVVVTPTEDNIKALCIGIMKAHSDNKALLCWSLTCAAARQVLGMGFHRNATYDASTAAEAEIQRAMFWWVYIFDKNLALRLGRTPNIQDYDIDVKWFKVTSAPGIAPYERTNVHFAKLARVQGLIYEKLYSVAALHSRMEERTASIQRLSNELRGWYEEWQTFDNSQAEYPAYFDACFNIIDPVYYATQALIHRASSPPGTAADITPVCYDYACKSLQEYLKTFRSMQNEEPYLFMVCFVDEIMFYTSLTPLIVVFLHAITNPNHGDVDMLLKCQETLEHLKKHSKDTARVLRVCKIFGRVARSRLQAANTKQNTTPLPSGNGSLSDIQQAMQYSTSSDWGSKSHDEFGSFSTPEDFDFNQMNAFFTGWLDQDKMPNQLFDMDFVGNATNVH